jgi:plastocyanin
MLVRNSVRFFAFGIVLAALFLAGCYDTTSNGETGTTGGISSAVPVLQAAVEITNTGFSLQTVAVTKGGTVTWTNRGTSAAWVASAVHPTHQLYLGFDELQGMAPGESWSFTFNNVGSWKYHNHLSPLQIGTVNVVEETAVS